MYKRAVRAVFQQAAHQIRQQIVVVADRCINAAAVQVLIFGDFVQRLAHAVQALEFVVDEVLLIVNQMQNRTHGVGVVRGELRVDAVIHGQQQTCARQI